MCFFFGYPRRRESGCSRDYSVQLLTFYRVKQLGGLFFFSPLGARASYLTHCCICVEGPQREEGRRVQQDTDICSDGNKLCPEGPDT